MNRLIQIENIIDRLTDRLDSLTENEVGDCEQMADLAHALDSTCSARAYLLGIAATDGRGDDDRDSAWLRGGPGFTRFHIDEVPLEHRQPGDVT